MTYKVMIADDEPIMRKAMQSLIDWKSLDCELNYVASTGQEIMQKLEEVIPDILILDIQMPGINGLDLAKHVWEQKLPTKVILLTAYADFSYAQSAIKYDVVDYVIKTGAFEGLVLAIEKAKEQLQKTESNYIEENIEVLKENFFKAVFDGTIDQNEKLIEKAESMGLNLFNGWAVVTIHFRLNEDKKRDYAYQSLKNFLRMVFEEQMVYGTALKKNLIVVVLSAESEAFQDAIREKCMQIVEMMSNFVKMNVYIGISQRGMELSQLKKAYDEAEYAIEEGFFYETSRINFYQGIKKEKNENSDDVERYLKDLKYNIKKGKKEEALELFGKLVQILRENGCSVNTMLDIGIEIKSWCKKCMNDFDKTLYDVVPYQGSISRLIYQCRHLTEYVELMNTIIENTAQHINIAISKKNVLIYEAEKYIEENYEKYITVSEVSRNVGVSLSYLSRIYKETTGITLIQFVNGKKIEKAKEYLGSTDMKIYEIAEALGFENTTYFSYFFKKHTGVSPKDYKDNRCRYSRGE
ncbi:MAG: response regulator [Suilimivivens sp.]